MRSSLTARLHQYICWVGLKCVNSLHDIMGDFSSGDNKESIPDVNEKVSLFLYSSLRASQFPYGPQSLYKEDNWNKQH
jgi:hypothetical protein